jgi:chromate transporter
VNALILYLLLLKATVSSFSGLASLPGLRQDLVVSPYVLIDEQLNDAFVVTRTTPGPVGLYVVSVGYFVAGVPGAIAGWAAMVTPTLLVIPLVHYNGRRAEHPRARNILPAVVLSSGGLLWAVTLPVGAATITNDASWAIFLGSLGALATQKIESLWVILAAAVVQLGATPLGLVARF